MNDAAMKTYRDMLAEFEVAPEHDDDEQCPICSAGDGDELCREAVECLVSDIQDELQSRPDPATVLGILLDNNLLGYGFEDCVSAVRRGADAVSTPQRKQRRRTRGWRLPPGAIYVGRGLGHSGAWGNQFRVGIDGTAAECVDKFRLHLETWRERDPVGFAAWLAPLRGHDLCCWCKIGEPCHGDILLALANE